MQIIREKIPITVKLNLDSTVGQYMDIQSITLFKDLLGEIIGQYSALTGDSYETILSEDKYQKMIISFLRTIESIFYPAEMITDIKFFSDDKMISITFNKNILLVRFESLLKHLQEPPYDFIN